MHAKTFLHKLLDSVIHQSRIQLLICVVNAVVEIKQLKLTALGRALKGIQERSGIRKIDRLLGNVFFQQKNREIYQALTRLVVGSRKRPWVIVDWTKLPNVNEYALRAALVAEGRAITLYEEVHPKKKEGNAKVHQLFLKHLKSLLPEECCPILVTDAGFRNAWFKAVLNYGWDYVGRVRGIIKYKVKGQWRLVEEFHQAARREPQYLGEYELSKSEPLLAAFYMMKQKLKGRKCYTKGGKRARDKDSKNYGRSHREPWVLVSSLKGKTMAKKVVKIYQRRMTIEEGFRDLKSSQYGFSMQGNKTLNRERLIVWLMIAALASLWVWLMGKAAEALKLHYCFQANSIRHRRVLSFFI